MKSKTVPDKPKLSIRNDHKERMMFNWNKQPLYTLPLPCVFDIEITELKPPARRKK